MKQRDDVVVCEQRRLAVDAFGEIAHHVGDRGLQLSVVRAQPARAHIVHPGTAAFALAGTGVQVKLAHQFALALNPVKQHAGMPHRRLVFAYADLKQGFNNFE